MDERNADWDTLRFRPRQRRGAGSPETDANSRFIYGALLFLIVALLYPWYSYRVQSYLMAADVERALSAAGKELQALSKSTDAAFRAAPAPQPSRRVAVPDPRILGVSEGSTASVIVADLDGASLGDAQRILCGDAERWLRRPPAGRTFRVQQYRATAPAITVGTIRC